MRTVIIMTLVVAVATVAGCKSLKNTKGSANSTTSAPTSLPTSVIAAMTEQTQKAEALTAANSQLQAQLKAAQNQLDDSQKQADSTRDGLTAMQARVELLENNNQAMRKALDLVAAAGNGQAGDKESLTVQLNNAAVTIDKLNMDNQRLREARKADRDQLVSVFDELEATRKVLTSNNSTLSKLQGENQQLAATNDALMQALDMARGGGRDTGRTNLTAQLEASRKTIARLNEDNKHLADQLSQQEQIIRDMQKKLADQKDKSDRPDTPSIDKPTKPDLSRPVKPEPYKPDQPDPIKPKVKTDPSTQPVRTIKADVVDKPGTDKPEKPVITTKASVPDHAGKPDQTDQPAKTATIQATQPALSTPSALPVTVPATEPSRPRRGR